MAVFSGTNGKLRWNNVITTRVSNWSLDTSSDLLETTDLGDNAKTFISGLKSATGSCSIFYHDDDNTLKLMINKLIANQVAQMGRLDLRWSDKAVTFDAFLNNVSISCSAGEVMTAEVSFTMNGNFVEVDL